MTDSHSFLEGDFFMNKAWIYVFLTSFFELVWIYGFNVASTWWHWLILLPIIVLDFLILTKACESLPTGTVYAVFAAAGTVGTALMDIYLFDEVFTIEKGFFIGLLVIGVIALNLTDDTNKKEVVK